MTRDAGLATLDYIHQRLMIDDHWTVRRERGFSWIGNGLIQHVDASPTFESFGLMVSQVVIDTVLVGDVKKSEAEIQGFLANKNGFAIGSALMFDTEQKTVHSVLAHTVHDETIEFRGSQLADFGVLQLIEAENSAAFLAAICNGVIATGEHPTNGPRLEADDMLNVGEEVFVPAGKGPSRFTAVSEMTPIYRRLENTVFASTGASDDRICIEVPFGPYDTSLIELRSDIAHPSLGAGLAVRSTIRMNELEYDANALAIKLQKEQLRTVAGGGQIGAWGVRPDLDLPHVAWSRFLPNAMFLKGLALDVAMDEIDRAVWVDRMLFPDLPSRNAWDIMKSREELRRNAAKSGHIS